ncbi:16949_t:CDS:2 [Funneliformis geosporum]|uniref:RNA polymerase II degradation factor 1 n=1 Tax=Funneliformis geosporum TaxID=1117311 RepID=A0A9W4SDI8_9GLOM|nr:16949_t:CDS:2 [Funneliformis geosporum]
MGSHDYDTQRTNLAGVGHKSNHAATEVAETEEVKHLKSLYKKELSTLQELFPNWTEADLLFALQEVKGELEATITRITEGHAAQWGEVKSRKSKKEHSGKNKQGGQQFSNVQAQRGHFRGGYSERGRARGEGGRGGRSNDRTRGSRRENGYMKPPRQQNGTNASNYDDTNNVMHGKARGTENTSNSKNNNNDSIGGNWPNEGTSTWPADIVTGDWSTDITAQGGSWSAENPAENANNTDKAQIWNKENATDSSQTGRNVENTQQSVKGSWTTDNLTENIKDSRIADISTDNITASRDIDKATDNLKHNRDSNITKDNWDIDHSKDNWCAENDGLAADTLKDNWGSDATKNAKNLKDVSRSPNTVMRSVAPTKSPVSHNLRTIPPQSKTSWAQIVKPESKPETKPEPISAPVHKSSETVKPISPNPVKSPLVSKVTESVIAPPPQETLTTTTIVTTKTEENIKEATSPEVLSVSGTSTATLVNASTSAKEVSPPGLHKTKANTNARRLKQDTAVVMPNTGAGLERVEVQFGSLNISNNAVEESSETESQILLQVQKTEDRQPVSVETSPQPQTSIQQQQQIVQQQTVQQQQVSQQQVAQQQSSQQQLQQAAQQQLQQQPQSSQPQSSTISQSNSINRLPTTSAQALPSSVGSAPTGTPAIAPNTNPQNFNPSYFKQQEQSSAYINQQHHLGLATDPLNGPYTSYLPNQHQPPNQISGFGIGPMQSLPAEYNAMYSPDAQRMMGYYADPTYGQASPVTSTGYQVQYYPYYYMTNQFPSAAYQQSGYGQPFVNKSMYPMYNHPHSTKPGSASGTSPYGYPSTPTTPNTPHHYSHTSNTGYEEVTGAQLHHHPGVPSVLDYQKPYGSMPPINFLGNAGGNNPQPAGSTNSSATGGKSSNNASSELNPPTQYKTYQEKTSTNAQPTGGVGQSGTQHQQPPTNPNYYGQQTQVFNNYQHPQTHHQYYQHQAHHQATNRNQQQYWTSQS